MCVAGLSGDTCVGRSTAPPPQLPSQRAGLRLRSSSPRPHRALVVALLALATLALSFAILCVIFARWPGRPSAPLLRRPRSTRPRPRARCRPRPPYAGLRGVARKTGPPGDGTGSTAICQRVRVDHGRAWHRCGGSSGALGADRRRSRPPDRPPPRRTARSPAAVSAYLHPRQRHPRRPRHDPRPRADRAAQRSRAACAAAATRACRRAGPRALAG